MGGRDGRAGDAPLGRASPAVRVWIRAVTSARLDRLRQVDGARPRAVTRSRGWRVRRRSCIGWSCRQSGGSRAQEGPQARRREGLAGPLSPTPKGQIEPSPSPLTLQKAPPRSAMAGPKGLAPSPALVAYAPGSDTGAADPRHGRRPSWQPADPLSLGPWVRFDTADARHADGRRFTVGLPSAACFPPGDG